MTDAWGRELRYRVNGDGTATIYSYGRDGLEGGGEGEDEDLEETVDYRDWLAPGAHVSAQTKGLD